MAEAEPIAGLPAYPAALPLSPSDAELLNNNNSSSGSDDGSSSGSGSGGVDCSSSSDSSGGGGFRLRRVECTASGHAVARAELLDRLRLLEVGGEGISMMAESGCWTADGNWQLHVVPAPLSCCNCSCFTHVSRHYYLTRCNPAWHWFARCCHA